MDLLTHIPWKFWMKYFSAKQERTIMSDEKIKTILESADGLTEQEWKSLKRYFDYKFSLNKRFINNELAFKTVKTFFNPDQESNL